MTVTDDNVVFEEAPEVDLQSETPETSEDDNGDDDSKGKDRDFSKVRQLHIDLASYVNEHSGLDPISPNQVKALLYLRPDFNNSPEKVAAREEAKARKAAENAKYEGMTEDQIKRHKQAAKAQEAAERAQKRAEEAVARAKAAAEAAESGEDIASAVESAQEATEAPSRRGIRRGGK